jgi:hypothetical protein
MHSSAVQESPTSEDRGRIRLSISCEKGECRFTVLENTAPQVLAFELPSKALNVDPQAGNAGRPYLFIVEFEAVGFTFETPADGAVIWKVPATRPPFVAPPKLEAGATLLRLFAVNASTERQAVQFELIPAGDAAAGEPIDPTIVNNPDPP